MNENDVTELTYAELAALSWAEIRNRSELIIEAQTKLRFKAQTISNEIEELDLQHRYLCAEMLRRNANSLPEARDEG